MTHNLIHENIGEGENFYVNIHKGSEQYNKIVRKNCLKLKKNLYCICQSPRTFWKYLMKKLEACGSNQSEFDP